MKKPLILIILVCSVILFSCTDNTKTEKPIVQNQTPEILDAKPEISSISKRSGSDIIEDLYDEAISKDFKLNELTERISEIDITKNDSLKKYNVYIQNNDRYWSSIDNYINQLADSTLKNELKTVFKDLELKYNTTITPHKLAIEKVNSKATTLNDCEILMKLVVTMPMMMNYQKNELPDITKLNNLVFLYDTLINNTKRYTRIVK